MRSSTVLSLPPHLVFPVFTFPFVLSRSVLNKIALTFQVITVLSIIQKYLTTNWSILLGCCLATKVVATVFVC